MSEVTLNPSDYTVSVKLSEALRYEIVSDALVNDVQTMLSSGHSEDDELVQAAKLMCWYYLGDGWESRL